MNFDSILAGVGKYYTEKVTKYGTTPTGADWNSQESQELRFEQLLKICDLTAPFSITDYGCGYGALVDYLAAHDRAFEYQGFDIAEEMITRAKESHVGRPQCEFLLDASRLKQTDYVVASGIFNVKMHTEREEWLQYLLATVEHMNSLSRKGFAFNVLTGYSDADRMRPDLYYADPLFLFDHCKRKYSRFVALLHDYPLYEFTILVRK